jgi:four helix bundle protein
MANCFEDLTIWQDARELAKLVHISFLTIKDYDFKYQMERAAVSVMNNNAKGFERYTKAEFARFLQIAKASNAEVRSMTYLAEDFNYLSNENAGEIMKLCMKIKTGIINLIKTLNNKQ